MSVDTSREKEHDVNEHDVNWAKFYHSDDVVVCLRQQTLIALREQQSNLKQDMSELRQLASTSFASIEQDLIELSTHLATMKRQEHIKTRPFYLHRATITAGMPLMHLARQSTDDMVAKARLANMVIRKQEPSPFFAEHSSTWYKFINSTQQ